MEYISVNKERPQDGQKCLVHFPNKTVKLLVYNEHYDVWDDEYGDDYYTDITNDQYWMPIPTL